MSNPSAPLIPSLSATTAANEGNIKSGVVVATNIWLGCEEDRLEELIEKEYSVPPQAMRDSYNRYVVLCKERGMHACSYLQYLKDWIAISEEDE